MKIPPDFDVSVYELVAQIPRGRAVSYKQLAVLMGFPDHARRVGRALAAAPQGLPCHRVVSSAGRTVSGWTAQRELLESEGVAFRPDGSADLRRCGWEALR
ncbi:MGMT family protein [Alistipes sp.]|uniref:MGMT family protein n=1 Tax=Alistipes sp. TaxID=1872444 RepID=UPI003AF1598A